MAPRRVAPGLQRTATSSHLLSLAQVHGALTYYYDHPEEIEADIVDGKRVEAEIERDRALHVKGHSGR